MRLGKRTKAILKEAVYRSFGDVDIYLFGSRVDDKKRGGDIDLAIDVNLSHQEMRAKKVKFFTQLLKMDFDYSVDIVSFNSDDELLKQEIQKSAIKL